MMRHALLYAALAVAGSAAAGAADVRGLWLTENRDGLVEIAACDEAPAELCGRLVWIEEPVDAAGRLDLDDKNPEPALRERPILGLRILEGFDAQPDGDGVFEGGTIYDPENGKSYRCKMTPKGADVLAIRGFIGISLLGRTTEWRRVPGSLGPPAESRP